MFVKVKSVLGCLLLVAAIAGTVLLVRDIHCLLLDADSTMRHADAMTVEAQTTMRATSQNLNAILIQTGIAADQARLAATEQRAYWEKTSLDSDKTVKALRLTIDRAALLLSHTDQQLNDLTFPNLNAQISQVGQSGVSSAKALESSADALHDLFADPHLSGLVVNLDQTSASLSQTAASGAHVAKFYETKLTKPASLAKTVLLGALDIVSKFGNIFSGFINK
jgi:hypothetical protein